MYLQGLNGNWDKIYSIEKNGLKFTVNGEELNNARKYRICYECSMCGKELNKTLNNYSPICRECKIKETNLEKYGVITPAKNSKVKEKIRHTNLMIYGTIVPAQNSEVKEKMRQTNLKKYGVENPYQSEEIKEKMRKTHLEKHGVEYFSQSEFYLDKVKNTSILKYNKEHYSKTEEWLERVKNTNSNKYGVENVMRNRYIKNRVFLKQKESILENIFNGNRLNQNIQPLFSKKEYSGCETLLEFKCLYCNTTFHDRIQDGLQPRCPTCFPKLSGHSKQEKEIVDWLNSLNHTVIENDRQTIQPLEIDIYLPLHNLAIEFNGVYWHSTEFITNENYHQNKVEMCYNQGIRLLHIWEDEWLENRQKIKERILFYIENKHILIKPQKPQLVEKNGYKIWV